LATTPDKRIVVAFAQFQNVARFIRDESFVNVGFDVNGFDDFDSLRSFQVIVDAKAAIEFGLVRRPRIRQLVQIPQVLVSVYDLHKSGSKKNEGG
jgi:hypothetical protein